MLHWLPWKCNPVQVKQEAAHRRSQDTEHWLADALSEVEGLTKELEIARSGENTWVPGDATVKMYVHPRVAKLMGINVRVTRLIDRVSKECEAAQVRRQAADGEMQRLKSREVGEDGVRVGKVEVHPKVMNMVEELIEERDEAEQYSRKVEDDMQGLLGANEVVLGQVRTMCKMRDTARNAAIQLEEEALRMKVGVSEDLAVAAVVSPRSPSDAAKIPPTLQVSTHQPQPYPDPSKFKPTGRLSSQNWRMRGMRSGTLQQMGRRICCI